MRLGKATMLSAYSRCGTECAHHQSQVTKLDYTCAASGTGQIQHNRLPNSNAGSRQTAYDRSEEHTSELQSLMRISYAVFCLKKKKTNHRKYNSHTRTKHNL